MTVGILSVNNTLKFIDIAPRFAYRLYILLKEKVSEYDQEMPQSQTNPWHRKEETRNNNTEPHDTKYTIKVKQPTLYSSAICLQNSTESQNKDQTQTSTLHNEFTKINFAIKESVDVFF